MFTFWLTTNYPSLTEDKNTFLLLQGKNTYTQIIPLGKNPGALGTLK